MIERADSKRSKSPLKTRRVKMPDGSVRHTDTTPELIAAELHAKSKLGMKEARLAAAEAKLGK